MELVESNQYLKLIFLVYILYVIIGSQLIICCYSHWQSSINFFFFFSKKKNVTSNLDNNLPLFFHFLSINHISIDNSPYAHKFGKLYIFCKFFLWVAEIAWLIYLVRFIVLENNWYGIFKVNGDACGYCDR